MNTISIYTDEAGAFTSTNKKAFIYGGLILFSDDQRKALESAYLEIEESIQLFTGRKATKEIKASNSSPERSKRFLDIQSSIWKFVLVIPQNNHPAIYLNCSECREKMLQYAYRLSVHSCLQALAEVLRSGKNIAFGEKQTLSLNLDQYTTQKSIDNLRNDFIQDIEHGFHHMQTNTVWPNVIPNLVDIELQQRDSKLTPLIRAADFVVHYAYTQEKKHWNQELIPNLLIFRFDDIVFSAQQIQMEYNKWTESRHKLGLNNRLLPSNKGNPIFHQMPGLDGGLGVAGWDNLTSEISAVAYEKTPTPAGYIIIPTWKFSMPEHNTSSWAKLKRAGGWNF